MKIPLIAVIGDLEKVLIVINHVSLEKILYTIFLHANYLCLQKSKRCYKTIILLLLLKNHCGIYY